jgi:hypothetical protein
VEVKNNILNQYIMDIIELDLDTILCKVQILVTNYY